VALQSGGGLACGYNSYSDGDTAPSAQYHVVRKSNETCEAKAMRDPDTKDGRPYNSPRNTFECV